MYVLTILMYMGISVLTLIAQDHYIGPEDLLKSTVTASTVGNLIFFIIGFVIKFSDEYVGKLFEATEHFGASIVQLALLLAFIYLSFLPLTILYAYISSDFIGGLDIPVTIAISSVLNFVHIYCFMRIIANITFHEECDATYYTAVAIDPFKAYFCTFITSCAVLLISNIIIGDIHYAETIKMSLYLSFLMTVSSYAYSLLMKSYEELFN